MLSFTKVLSIHIITVKLIKQVFWIISDIVIVSINNYNLDFKVTNLFSSNFYIKS